MKQLVPTLRPPTGLPISRSAGRGLALLLAGLLSAVAGCGGGETPSPSSEARTYAVRGVVRVLPEPGSPRREATIRHEAIDDFVDIRGTIVGMDSMTMPLPVAGEESLDGIAPGDAIEFDLVMDWEGSPPVVIRRIRKLPAGTELEFRQARVPE